MLTVLVAALLLLGGGAEPDGGPVPDAARQGTFIGVADGAALGDANAKVTIIEFGDYQCPFCRKFFVAPLTPTHKRWHNNSGRC